MKYNKVSLRCFSFFYLLLHLYRYVKSELSLNMKTKTFIVPHDFTPIANNALNHAIATAKTLNGQVFVLHVVPKEKNIAEAEIKLVELLKSIDTTVPLIPKVRVGNIFDDIGDFAAEHHAELIFMGTHGTQGWQHLTGSNALKVVTHSNIPFVIVQEKGINETGYDDIVVPLDLHKETKQKLAIVANLATYFKSRVHVITPDETDEFLRHKVKANIQFANRFFSERGIEVTATLAPSSGFDKEVVKHAVSLDADLIAIMNLNKNNLLGVITANYEKYIITNDAKIPTLIVNTIEGLSSVFNDFN
jgi:nucleotide-binding universal stress UspA family protein